MWAPPVCNYYDRAKKSSWVIGLFTTCSGGHNKVRGKMAWTIRHGQLITGTGTIRLNSTHEKDNFAKWLEYQILRDTIFTNDRVSRFKPNVSDKCNLCGLETENSYRLFYQCFVSQRFWVEIKQYLLIKFNLYLPVEQLSIIILFGILNQDHSSVLNTIII